ncbi:MAG: hypothetical protein M3539_06975, partial [Acidobacteriota bacterium]|nr:hypothetical protein [Acidobacteriota bacterium]
RLMCGKALPFRRCLHKIPRGYASRTSAKFRALAPPPDVRKALPFRHGPHYIHEATPHVILSQEIILLYISLP